MSKHGGSPDSGLVLPIGLEALKPATPEGMVLVPQEVLDARKQAKEREERALQLARRKLADGYLPELIRSVSHTPTSPEMVAETVDCALAHADALIAKTGGGI